MRRVALLRGVNVGTAKRISMADLRKLFEGLGYDDVRTLLNSGNVVFTAKKSGDDAARIEKAIVGKLGVSTRVTVLTGQELAAAIRKNPLEEVADNPSLLLLAVLRDSKAAVLLKPLVKARWAPEFLVLDKRVAYLWCAKGIAKSPLWAEVNRAAGEAVTARNLSTMTKLLSLVEGS